VEAYYRLAHEPAQKAAFVPGKTRVNYAGRVFDQEAMRALVDSSLDFWLTAGRYAETFSGKLEDYYDVSDVILTNSGSSSNLLAVSALTAESLDERRLAPGDEVITVAAASPLPWPRSSRTALYPSSSTSRTAPTTSTFHNWKRLFGATKAVFIAHTSATPSTLDAVGAFCRKHSLWLIE
jgi:CDP-6-deoxy-D-xylo-4-hexulose-3-dehydrase